MNASLNALLKQNSRSFYLTLRVLPGPIRPQISLAYLLARTTDTIADTDLVPLERRLGALDALRARILGLNEKPVELGELVKHQGTSEERVLLEHCEQALELLGSLAPGDVQKIRE